MFYQWLFHDEFKTALLYEISSCILEQLSIEIAVTLQAKIMTDVQSKNSIL
jgi:hypothetical protein